MSVHFSEREFACPGRLMPQPAGAPQEGFVACYRAGHRCTSATHVEVSERGTTTQTVHCPCCGDFQGSITVPRAVVETPGLLAPDRAVVSQ